MIQRKPLLTFLSIIFESQIVYVSVYMYTLKNGIILFMMIWNC